MSRLINYYTVAFKSLSNLKVILGKEVDTNEIVKSSADAVVVATSAEALVPDMSGVDMEKVITAHELLAGRKAAGETVVVVGTGSVGCEVASHIAGRGKKVTVVEMLDAVATDADSMVRIGLLKELSERGVNILTGVKINAITEDGAEGTDHASRETKLKADAVVLALGAKSRDELAKELSGKVKELYIIGDAKKPRRIGYAISEGYAIAYDI